MNANYGNSHSGRRTYLSLNDEQIFCMAIQIMSDHKPYLEYYLTLDELAGRMDVSRNALSRAINLYAKMSFTTWLTIYRVTEMERLAEIEENRTSSLAELAKQAGFASRTSFYRGFRNIRGITPEEWRKKKLAEQ